MTRTHAVLALLFATLLPACDAARGGAPASAVRDSAGVRIVESTAPAWKEGEGWRLSARPVRVIGSEEDGPAYQFGGIAGAVRLPGGAVAVGDRVAAEVRLFDAAGRYARTIGKKGSGPGEFQDGMVLFPVRGDSLGAWDFMAARLSVFTPEGSFARSVSVHPGGRVFPRLDGVFADGSLLVNDEMSLVFSESHEARRDSARLLHYTPDAARHDTIGRYAGPEVITVTGEEDGGWAVRSWVPFGGESFRRVHGNHFFLADNARYEVQVRDPAGRLVRVLRRAHQPQPLTEEEVRAHKAERLAGMEARFRAHQERVQRAMPYPKTRAAFDEMLVDRAGNVWLQGWRAADAATVSWTVLDAEGRWLGEVAMPHDLRVTDVGADYVLGVRRDEMEVERVEEYRLEKPRGGS